jgi:hypothetical protein
LDKFTEFLATIGDAVSQQIKRMPPWLFALWVTALVALWRLPEILKALGG